MSMLLARCGELDVVEKNYETYTTAVEAGDAGNMWVPDILPRSATNIRVRYNIDSGETWLRFSFAADYSPAGTSDVQLLDPAAAIDAHLRGTGASGTWWPKPEERPAWFAVYRYRRYVETAGGRKYVSDALIGIDSVAHEAYYVQGPKRRQGRH